MLFVDPYLLNNEGSNSEETSDQDTASGCNNKEWTYTMRRDMQEVVPGVFLGPYSVACRSKLKYLTDHGITHIICIRQDIEANFIKPNFPDNFVYLVLDIADNKTQNIIQYFRKVKIFIDEGLSLGGQILVHSNAGISRSAALVLAYIMETYQLSHKTAFGIVQHKRFCINPNEGFMAQLKEYEPIYHAYNEMTTCSSNCNAQCTKRKRHEISYKETMGEGMSS